MLAEWIVLPPFLAALAIGTGILSGRLAGERGEPLTRRVAFSAAAVSGFGVLAALFLKGMNRLDDQVSLGTWLESGDYQIRLSFAFDTLSLALSALVALFAVMVLRFSGPYMHREAGFHRFFLVLSLFTGAMLLLVTAGNAALAFAGWELAGVCSYLLIAYAYDRPVAAGNATRAFITNRIGDAGFVAGIFLAFAWTGSIEWPAINGPAQPLAEWQAGTLAGCFLLAAVAKSALVPLSPWIARAMEGPTPSSAVFYGALMVHAGVYLVIRLEPVFEQAPIAMALMAGVGLLTALYGFVCGLVQTDVKSALIFSTSGQVGLMFLEAGLGYWQLALWHLCAHAVVRGYQFLSAPSLMHRILGQPTRPVSAWLGQRRWLYLAALQRLWLEPLGDWLVVKPVLRLSRDASLFDGQVLDRFWGPPLPAIQRESTTGQTTATDPTVIRASGLFGRAVAALATLLFWFEDRLVLQGVGQKLVDAGRRLGVRLNRLETLLNEPRYLVLFIAATLLAVI
ncbi:MAG: NADH/Ubiquinone/plastoquinone [Proteobacteria bacterium]|nr:NADH/Ubiquinone/plastoquinone [Pseudomonadota bacterium]